MGVIKNYKSSLLLLGGIILGGIVGTIFGEQTEILKPIGDMFLNCMFVLIVPLVFLSLVSAITSTKEMKRLGRILSTSVVIFLVTAVIAAIVSYITVAVYNPFQEMKISQFGSELGKVSQQGKQSIGELLVKTLTVGNFLELFDKANLLPLILFSIFFGVAITLVGEKATPLTKGLDAANAVIMKLVDMVMKLAPIGLGCYFAYTLGQLGTQIIGGYAKGLLLYLIVTVVYYFGMFTIYAYVAGKKQGVKNFWKHVASPSLTAMGTSSSVASIPANLIATKKMGVPDDIAETVIPLGANIHKDGSVIGGMLKVVFLYSLYGKSIHTLSAALTVIGVALLVGVVVGSIPSGGLTAEIMIVTLFGFPIEMVPVIAVISTIIDIPATLLNSTGNTVCAMMVSRVVEGKDWLEN